MNTNYDVINFLNLTNPRLGKMYKLSGYNPLPEDFVLDESKVKEILSLQQMGINDFPSFIYEEKKIVKKYFKNSIKNCKKILKNINFLKNCDAQFIQKLEIYLDIRVKITSQILKEFKNQRFDECEAYEEISNLNPIFAQHLEELFYDNVDLEKLLNDLEDKYRISYIEKTKILEQKKKKKEKQKQTIKQVENPIIIESHKKIAKKENTPKKEQKIEKKQEKNQKKITKKENKQIKEKE